MEISPCFPAEWERAEMTRHFRNADCNVVIENPKHLEAGSPIIFVDGVQIEGNIVEDFRDERSHEIRVVLA